MVLGLKSKQKKGAPVKVEYIVHVEEISPWPPSESLKSVQTVLLLWENGEQNSGSFLSVAGDSNIMFNESFMLPLTLKRDKKVTDKFKKNYLEFSLFEPRKDKAKGQLLGTASLNLADYGVIEDISTINAPLNFKKSYNNSVPSALTITFEPVEKDSDADNSSYNDGLSTKDASIDNDDDESEITSYTDDDASSHSSRTAGSFDASPSQNDKDGYGNDHIKARNKNLRPLWSDASSETGNHVNNYVSSSKFSERSMTSVRNSTPFITSSPSSISFRDTNTNMVPSFMRENKNNTNNNTQHSLEDSFQRFASEVLKNDSHVESENDGNSERKLIANLSEEGARRQVTMRSDTLIPNRKAPGIPLSGSNRARLKHMNSYSQIHGTVKGNGLLSDVGKPVDLDIPNGSQKKGKSVERKEPKSEVVYGKNEWKSRVEMLEEELREIAAIEVGLYSVVAEHGSSGNKVHAPARRLSRLYSNASKEGSQAKRASAARAAVSGLVLVSKACGNDVPRLTFWLSNAIMLRAIVSQIAAELPHSNGPKIKSNDLGPELTRKNPHKRDIEKSKLIQESDDWEDIMTFIIALEKLESWLFSRIVESVWWQTFTPHMQPNVAKVSSKTTSSVTKKPGGRRNTFSTYEHGSFSMELWKKAFKDACEKLCPMRASGHECGCLSVLFKLVMEQLVNRLDMAMFNAILRESAEEMPTDPVSDPISDSRVLPIPAGKSSFGAGAQLKNAIGNWSRWLTDLFGLEDDSPETSDIFGGGQSQKSFKAFRLLHALSDLMMLPFGMLADISIRKEVCPSFGPIIIKRVLNNFVPDEFSPDPIPRHIIDALNSEEISGDINESFPYTVSPTKYTPPPAALLTCVGEVGSQVLQSSRLSTLKKSYTSDDELDELDSPLTSIIPDSYQSSSALAKLSLMPKEKGGRNVVRYQLLREIWRDEE
ncbi:hypothetical protein ACJIZ3_004581 [Penstemon smallii]|uniref:C2 NT-type domain-containing protein n=1 Tax=Penstemon smallii TaxID=265156 RepID=A0ABD3S2H3_9LAMI